MLSTITGQVYVPRPRLSRGKKKTVSPAFCIMLAGGATTGDQGGTMKKLILALILGCAEFPHRPLRLPSLRRMIQKAGTDCFFFCRGKPRPGT